MRPIDPDRKCHVPQLEERRSWLPEFCSGPDRILRHLVLPGGIKTGADPIIDWAQKLGFGAKSGIPIRGEVEGRVPNDSYMKATHGRKLLNGDIANLSIGQGDTQVTPLQMAQAMSIVANGGTFYQTRLVQQVQSIDSEIVTAYQCARANRHSIFPAQTMAQLRTGMVERSMLPPEQRMPPALNRNGGGQDRHRAVGAEKQGANRSLVCRLYPRGKAAVCVCCVYEGDVGVKAHGGTVAAPMIAQVLKELYKGEQANGRRHRRPQAEESPTVRRAEPVEEDAGLTRISCSRRALSGSIGSFGAATERRSYSAGDYLRKLELDQALIHHRVRDLEEAGDVRAVHIIARRAVLLRGAMANLVDRSS